MKIKFKLRMCLLIAGGCLAAGAIISTYAATVLRLQLTDAAMIRQTQTAGAVSRYYAEKHAVRSADTESRISEYFAPLRQNAIRILRSGKDLRSQSLDILGIDYFETISDTIGLFSSRFDLPQAVSCAPLLGVSEKVLSSAMSAVNISFADADAIRCVTLSGRTYPGYLMPDDRAGLHYILLKKPLRVPELTPKDAAPPKTEIPADLIAEGSLAAVFTRDAKAVYSSDPAFPQQIIKPELLEQAAGSSPLRTVLTDGSGSYLAAITADSSGAFFTAAVTQQSRVILPAVITAVLAGCVCLILLAVFLTAALRSYRRVSAGLVSVTGALQKLGDDPLTDPAALPQITAPLASTDHDELGALSSTAGDLGRKLGSTLSALIEANTRSSAGSSAVITMRNAQRTMLPDEKDMPSTRFIEFGSYMIPCRNRNLSDFYDVFKVDRDNTAFVLGSVNSSAHGIESLRFMSETLVLLRKAIQNDGMRPADAFNMLNACLAKRNHNKTVISIIACIMSEFTGNFIVANAGFHQPFTLHMGLGREMNLTTGPALLQSPESIYIDNKAKLDFGDTMLMVSEGLCFAKNAEEENFGSTRILSLLEKNRLSPATECLSQLSQEVRTFTAGTEISLDMSAICIKKNGFA